MPKVTKEMMRSLIDAGVMPPRHKRGCPKNYLRTIPLPCAAHGMTLDQIKAEIQKQDATVPCTCEE